MQHSVVTHFCLSWKMYIINNTYTSIQKDRTTEIMISVYAYFMIIGKPDYSSQNKNHIYPLGSIRPHHFPEAGKMVPSFNSIKVRLRRSFNAIHLSTYIKSTLLKHWMIRNWPRMIHKLISETFIVNSWIFVWILVFMNYVC